jgi:hypothetical protein
MYVCVRGIVTKPVPSQEDERSCICVRGIATKPVPSQEEEMSYICVIFLLDFETVPLELLII